MADIDNRLLDSSCQANIDENFNRTLALVAGGGSGSCSCGIVRVNITYDDTTQTEEEYYNSMRMDMTAGELVEAASSGPVLAWMLGFTQSVPTSTGGFAPLTETYTQWLTEYIDNPNPVNPPQEPYDYRYYFAVGLGSSGGYIFGADAADEYPRFITRSTG